MLLIGKPSINGPSTNHGYVSHNQRVNIAPVMCLFEVVGHPKIQWIVLGFSMEISRFVGAYAQRSWVMGHACN